MHSAADQLLMPPRPTALAQQILREVIGAGDLVIDATAGNGHDTVFLAECVGEAGRVMAFDVQAAAITAARARVTACGLQARVTFFQQSHAGMDACAAAGSVAVVMFNLGYLPGAEHLVRTTTETTLNGLNCAMRLLQNGGVLAVTCYPGHPGGDTETAAVTQWLVTLAAAGWRVAQYGAIGTLRAAPVLLLGVKPR
jgi:ubiquinone/menaquinone biosynthesis C-methylase UbiE